MTVGLGIAGLAWLVASLNFTGLKEEPGASEGGKAAISAAFENLSLLKTEPQLRRFILVRGLLTGTALAPPFMIAAGAGEGADGYGGLGFLLLASAFASLVSGTVWGVLSDRSSRMVLILSAVSGAIALALTVGLSLSGYLSVPFVLPVVLFGLMIAYQGVRLGRSTHLVDMAHEETRAAYTALSNTVIGVLLLLGSGFSALAALTGPVSVIGVMAVMCALAGFFALGLDEVQAD